MQPDYGRYVTWAVDTGSWVGQEDNDAPDNRSRSECPELAGASNEWRYCEPLRHAGRHRNPGA